MAKTVIVRSICDRCKADGIGEVESAEETGFSYDGYSYALDLCGPHAEDFHNTVQSMIAWSSDRSRAPEGRGRRSNTPAAKLSEDGRGPARRDKEQIGAIRDWANANGYKVSNRGRIPADVELAYNAAH
jgi:hypothetical protein